MSTCLLGSICAQSPTRKVNHKIAGKRRAVSCTLRSVERSFSAVLGASDISEYFPSGYSLAPSCMYIRALRHTSRGLLAAGEFDKAFFLLDRVLTIALGDAFVLSGALQQVPTLQILVANLDRDVRLFEAAFSVLKQTVRSELNLH